VACNHEASAQFIDRGWLYETATILDDQGCKAMIAAAKTIGVTDEVELSRFVHPNLVNKDTLGIASTALRTLKTDATKYRAGASEVESPAPAGLPSTIGNCHAAPLSVHSLS